MSTNYDVSTPHGQAGFLAEHGIVGDADELRAIAWAGLRAAGDRARAYMETDPTHRPGPSPMYALLLLALLDRAEAGDDSAAWIIAEAVALAPLGAEW